MNYNLDAVYNKECVCREKECLFAGICRLSIQ